MRHATLGLAVCLGLGLASGGFAQELKVSGTTVSVSFPGHALVTLEIAGPKGFHQQVYSKGSSAAINIGAAADGLYKYEASGTSGQKVENYNPLKLDNGRSDEPSMVYVGSELSGAFVVERGSIILPKPSESDRDG